MDRDLLKGGPRQGYRVSERKARQVARAPAVYAYKERERASPLRIYLLVIAWQHIISQAGFFGDFALYSLGIEAFRGFYCLSFRHTRCYSNSYIWTESSGHACRSQKYPIIFS